MLINVKPEWLKLSNKYANNDVADHELVPEHRVLSQREVADLCTEYDIERVDLPRIKPNDPALEGITCFPGDVVEIVRDSRTAETARSYRFIEPKPDQTLEDSTTEWNYNPTVPKQTYTPAEELETTLARHILGNMGASMPPTRIGTCRWVAVDREEEIEKALNRAIDTEPLRFIQGELGYGKSFFLHWLRDRIADKAAVSTIDLGQTVTFESPEKIVREVRNNIHTPRSIEHDFYANGMDELWDTFVSSVVSGTVDYLDGRGFQLIQDRVEPNVITAIRRSIDSIGNEDYSMDLDQLETIAVSYVNNHSSYQSFSSEFSDSKINQQNAFEILELLGSLAALQDLPVIIGVDELEKSRRTQEHFEAVHQFVQKSPANVSLFVTGTPELVEGTGTDTGIRGTYQPLYDLVTDNRIILESPTENDLHAFTNRLIEAEKEIDEMNTYTNWVQEAGSIDMILDEYTDTRSGGDLTFRSFIQFFGD
jgi:DNA-directed RNA polymerase subunit H